MKYGKLANENISTYNLGLWLNYFISWYHLDTGWASLIRYAWYRKCLGFRIFSNFGIFAYYSEIAWGREPNLNVKSIYVSCRAYEYIGFIQGVKTNWTLNLNTTSNWALNLFTSIYICTALCSCRRAKRFGFWRFRNFRISDKGYSTSTEFYVYFPFHPTNRASGSCIYH
jgi:hypothetical protein